jgi:hypothetical protein
VRALHGAVRQRRESATCSACHSPSPRDVGMPRSFKAAAIA